VDHHIIEVILKRCAGNPMLSLNYFDSKVDLYINGTLERTFYFTNNIPNYSSTESVLLGSDNGLAGAICNVSYNKILFIL
jgi:hypothetical protein